MTDTVIPLFKPGMAQANANAGGDPLAALHVVNLPDGRTVMIGHPMALAAYYKQMVATQGHGEEKGWAMFGSIGSAAE